MLVFTLISPLNALADGYLFSAHMLQHILLLLIVPALLLMSLPRCVSLGSRSSLLGQSASSAGSRVSAQCGSGMHGRSATRQFLRTLSRAANFFASLVRRDFLAADSCAARRGAHLAARRSALSFQRMRCLQRARDYYHFSPVSVCPIYTQPPADQLGIAELVRANWGITPEKDQQIGGLLMWVPMCLIYLSAIIAQLARWFAQPLASARPSTKLDDRRKPTDYPCRLGAVPHEQLPRPNFFPAGLAMGTTFIFWGLITSWVIFAVGIALFIAALAGWIYEILHERNHH